MIMAIFKLTYSFHTLNSSVKPACVCVRRVILLTNKQIIVVWLIEFVYKQIHACGLLSTTQTSLADSQSGHRTCRRVGVLVEIQPDVRGSTGHQETQLDNSVIYYPHRTGKIRPTGMSPTTTSTATRQLVKTLMQTFISDEALTQHDVLVKVQEERKEGITKENRKKWCFIYRLYTHV